MKKQDFIKLSQLIILVAFVFIIVYQLNNYLASGYNCETGTFFSTDNFWLVTLAALTDSINPCAIAVLTIMLEGLILIRKSVIKVGLSFIAGIFLSYLLIGLGIFKGFQLIENVVIFHKIIAVLAILVGLANIKDYFFYDKWFKTEIPTKWRPKMGTIISQATGPLLALGIGFVVSVFELPCTGGPYLFAIGVLKDQTLSILPYLIYYNLIFVLPLVVLVLLVYFSYIKIEETEKWRKKNIKLLHLVAGIVMLGLGIWLWL